MIEFVNEQMNNWRYAPNTHNLLFYENFNTQRTAQKLSIHRTPYCFQCTFRAKYLSKESNIQIENVHGRGFIFRVH